MLKAILLDFDGLIVDTELVWYNVYLDWFRQHKSYELTVQEFLLCVGSDSTELFARLAKKGCHVDPETFSRDTMERFIAESSLLPAKDGVTALLKGAKERGLHIALATSSRRAKPTFHLTRLALLAYFDLLVTAEDVTNIKPAPDLFLAAAERLGVLPSECLVVEDSLNGLLAGQAAGMRVLVVPNDVTRYCSFTGEFLRLDSLAELNLDRLAAGYQT